jgi:RNA polymerase sigma-70 factor (ECF subfamily)
MLFSKPLSELTDAELILAYKNSQQKELVGELYKRYTGLVYGVCLKYLKERELAKDAVMQLFEKLLTTLLTHEVSQFKSWLYVSARNHCLMHLRSMKGKIQVEISPSLMENQGEEHLNDGAELENNLSKLEKCIETLNTEQKKCVQLFFLQERCYQEVSEHTGYDLLKVKSYIQNGKRNLKICMERND